MFPSSIPNFPVPGVDPEEQRRLIELQQRQLQYLLTGGGVGAGLGLGAGIYLQKKYGVPWELPTLGGAAAGALAGTAAAKYSTFARIAQIIQAS